MSGGDEAVYETNISEVTLLARGKVRDIYEVDQGHLLIVATDRLSAYDVVLPDAIPGKGCILTRISRFWFSRTRSIVANHLVDKPLAGFIEDSVQRVMLQDRAMLVRRLTPLPMEAVVRGYLIGSGWRDYQDTGQVCGITLPSGLPLAAELETPLFTPATKAAAGAHDENIGYETLVGLIGTRLAEAVRSISLRIYTECAAYARKRGIIIADTKFEFGRDDDGNLFLIDEILTPDSSRFWPAESYRTGTSPPSFDKQYVRDYLETLDWDKKAPGPHLPAAVIARTGEKYHQALRILTGQD